MNIEPYLAYEAFLKDRIPLLSPRQRLFFAAWCCDRLWADFGEPYLARIGTERAAMLRDAYYDLWSDLLANRPIQDAGIRALLPVLEALDGEHAEYVIELDSEECAVYLCYHYTITCAVSDSADEAFYCGVELAQLADQYCGDSEMKGPIFTGEVRRQQEMVEYLTRRSSFDAGDRTLFREAYPFWQTG